MDGRTRYKDTEEQAKIAKKRKSTQRRRLGDWTKTTDKECFMELELEKMQQAGKAQVISRAREQR